MDLVPVDELAALGGITRDAVGPIWKHEDCLFPDVPSEPRYDHRSFFGFLLDQIAVQKIAPLGLRGDLQPPFIERLPEDALVATHEPSIHYPLDLVLIMVQPDQQLAPEPIFVSCPGLDREWR